MVIVKGVMMITWLLLASLFCKTTQDGKRQENGILHCGPQNVTVSSFGQMILLTWEDEPSCSSVQDVLVYEIGFLIADKEAHYQSAITDRCRRENHIHDWDGARVSQQENNRYHRCIKEEIEIRKRSPGSGGTPGGVSHLSITDRWDRPLSADHQILHTIQTVRPSVEAGKLQWKHVKDEVAVTPDQIGSTHSWNWTSLTVDCGSYSVRLRSRYKNHTSPWKQQPAPTVIQTQGRPEIFPKDRRFKVGSRATFCCVLPVPEDLKNMYLVGYNTSHMNTTKISDQIYALTVQLNKASKDVCFDVKCKTINNRSNGACAYVGYPPDYSDLKCETQDLKSVDCYWTVGRDTKESITHQLLGSPCTPREQQESRCFQEVNVDVGERNWTLTAVNVYGKVELTDTADLTKRVHMFPPKEVTASTVNARNVTLEWGWTVQQYCNLNISCQVNFGENSMSEIVGVALDFTVLNDLIPNWTYNVKLRCRTVPHSWKWSNWSKTINFTTKGDVPDALDVWMQRKDNQVIIVWKRPLANQSHGDIIDYKVTWTKTGKKEHHTETVASSNHSLALSLDPTEQYLITVTARNINGSSSPTTITIPSFSSDKVEKSWIVGSNGSFHLSWSASPTASCGYIVDWCPTIGHCSVQWLKVSPNETSARIFSKDFVDGQRYSLSVYALSQGAPVLLERREGYVREKKMQDGLFKPLNWKQRDSDCEVFWDPVPLSEQTAFIQGYVLYCLGNGNVISFNTDNPQATSLTATDLKISSYTFIVKAKTSVGECGDTPISATLNSQTDTSIKVVIICLATTFGLLSLVIILCFLHWTSIKQKICPPIPKPVLTSLDEHRSRPAYVSRCHPVEAEIMDVPELHWGTGAQINGYVTQENMPFVFSQTPEGYSNKPLVKNLPSSLSVHSTPVPAEAGLGSSSLIEFPNPSYNPGMQPGDKQFHLGLQLQEETSLARSSSGYQPQGHTEPFTIKQMQEELDSPISCDSNYILLPQSPSR